MLADKIVPTSMTHSTMLLSRLAAEMPTVRGTTDTRRSLRSSSVKAGWYIRSALTG
jgi:hypothetical protein